MKILFHICCSNCALYPVKLIKTGGDDFTGFWYNPNIHPFDEYWARLDSLKKLSDEWRVDVLYSEKYAPEEYFNIFENSEASIAVNGSNGLKKSPERCKSCYRLRLEKTAARAHDEGFEAFSTTLLISPYQDFEQLVLTGRGLAEKYNVEFYLKDFRPYFRDTMSLSKELGLYRQKYCGCLFSKEERDNSIRRKNDRK